MTESDVLIGIEGVSFSYGETKVLDRVTFPIRRGDFLSIIGPNGSGKTTLIKIILGLLTPSEGRIKIFGEKGSVFTQWEKLGYVPQKATHVDPFFPVSVREVVEMGLLSSRKYLSTKKKSDEDRVRSALKQVGMGTYEDRRVGALSGGQQQRVFIARAIVNQPHILFLDEPTTGVDAETQEHFYDMLGDLNKKESITIVLITHDIGIVNKHVSQVACLHQTLQYHGSHEEFCQSDIFKKMITEGHHVISHRH
ncbi:MAG: metal ABC transporter ATP-binding protein [Candidatus Aminicenantes bacterium]